MGRTEALNPTTMGDFFFSELVGASHQTLVPRPPEDVCAHQCESIAGPEWLGVKAHQRVHTATFFEVVRFVALLGENLWTAVQAKRLWLRRRMRE